ncbi:hypothetical protein BAUCODRAFT_145918 [Baudoinia panamericana UAMH 10762]|uniref:Signal recognition particle subunit SRP72 n=1 Tax=Baudoinia panamericana (strain UAMH 10762) TaxID=717646 RepID=M2MQ65_BAUPA|nr:uncharacterized protein BAUCODRAFT_145918 [Baudoinia panamericana UAMH 10762]EMC98916.1 hypothetical protein BAUCODRAFT_145918 [Baudoinia panamericana UAMH 10762]
MSTSVPSLTSLLKRADIEDHEEVLRAADAAIKQNKADVDALHARIVALLKLDRFDDAIRAFETGGDVLKEKARLEYAYALYKAGKPLEAAQLVHESAERGHRHVAAQASYRTEDFKRAAELYQDLTTTRDNDAIADLRINAGAADAQLEWSHQGELVRNKKPAREDLEAFETAYNAACGSIARGELGQGEVLLKRAKDLCNALTDLSEEEKRIELLPITVQHTYVLTRQGRTTEAEGLAKSIDVNLIPDSSTRYIAHVNQIAASSTPANPFLAQRLLSRDAGVLRADKPFTFQTSALGLNKYAIDLQSLKFAGVAESAAAVIAKHPAPTLDAYTNTLAVANAAAHAKAQAGKEALKHILPVLEKRPNDVGLILTIVQLYVTTGNSGSAITLLQSFLDRLEQSSSAADMDVRFAPGLVGTMVSVYGSSGRREPVRVEYAKAAQHWRRKSKERPTGVVHLLKAAGGALLESPEAEHRHLAKEILTALHHLDNNDRYAAAGLLAALPDTASPGQLSSLQPVERLIAGVDIDALESAGIAQAPLSADAAALNARKRLGEDIKPKKPKRLRKSRLPKDYDPNKKPDPERWLPLRDRSTYRPKGKKGKAKQNLFSQGAAPAVDSDGSRPATPGTPAGEVVKGKQPVGSGGAKKKKAKGKK